MNRFIPLIFLICFSAVANMAGRGSSRLHETNDTFFQLSLNEHGGLHSITGCLLTETEENEFGMHSEEVQVDEKASYPEPRTYVLVAGIQYFADSGIIPFFYAGLPPPAGNVYPGA